jgi:sulfoxide reductase heme-binding subunit YedZ
MTQGGFIWLRRAVVAVALLPLVRLFAWPALDLAGANPVEFVTRSSGTWTLVLLCVALAVTPVRKLTGANWLVRLRRPLGLVAFAYACAHALTWVWLDQWFELGPMLADIVKRPFITVGFAAFVLLLPLALTSTDAMMRRLGRRWGMLHRMVYPAAILAVLHYWWHKAGKNDLGEPVVYALVVAVLLLARLLMRRSAGAGRGSDR